MPTTRPRHMLTETDELALALVDAALVWPELAGDKAALLKRLLEAGALAIKTEGGVKKLVEETSGAASGCYPPRAREQLLGEWPA